MKKKLIIICLIMVSMIYGEESNKYIQKSFLDTKIYFPKTTSKYINDLLTRNDNESYYELAKVYIQLDKKEAGIKYLEEYEKTSEKYLEISELYNELQEYEKEVKAIEKYIPQATLKEKEIIYEYIKGLSEKEKLDLDISKYEILEYEKLKSLINDEKEYEKYYNEEKWSEEDKMKIKKDLSELDLEKNQSQKVVYFSMCSNYEKLDYAYSKIEDISDLTGFYEYFELAQILGIELSLKDDYEELYYFKWTKQEKKLKELKEKILERELVKKDFNNLYKLYIVDPDIKLLYNLALEDERYFYKFIENNISNEKYREILFNNFSNNYPDSQNILKLKELFIKYEKDNSKKLEILEELLLNEFDSRILDKKLNILEELERMDEYEYTLKYHIFNKYQDEKYIKKYIKLLEGQKRIEELYIELQKLNDKNYFFEIATRNNYKLPLKYKKELIEYLIKNKEYGELFEYKEELNYDQYKILFDKKQYQFIESAREKYPIKKEWMDINTLKYIYFNSKYDKYDEETINKLLDKTDKKDAEIYYIAKYYNETGNYRESLIYVNAIYDTYNYDAEINRLRNENMQKLEEIKKEEIKEIKTVEVAEEKEMEMEKTE